MSEHKTLAHVHDYQATLSESAELSYQSVVAEVLKVMKGGCEEADHRANGADPGVIYIEVGAPSNAMARFSAAIQKVAPKSYDSARNGPIIAAAQPFVPGIPGKGGLPPVPHQPAVPAVRGPPVPLPLRAYFLNPISDINGAVNNAFVPMEHRVNMDIVERAEFAQLTLDEFGAALTNIRAANPRKKIAIHYPGTLHQATMNDFAVLNADDLLFFTELRFVGDGGMFPTRKPEMSWIRDGKDLIIRKLGASYDKRRRVDVTPILSEGYIQFSSITHTPIALAAVLPHQVIRHYVDPFTGAVTYYDVRSGVEQMGMCINEHLSVADVSNEALHCVHRAVIVNHQPKFKTREVQTAIPDIDPALLLAARNLVSRVSLDASWLTIRQSLQSNIASVINACGALSPTSNQAADAVATAFEQYVESQEVFRKKLGAMTREIREARIESKIYESEGFFTRRAAASNSSLAGLFLDIRRCLTDGGGKDSC
jgi:hypothetical protein